MTFDSLEEITRNRHEWLKSTMRNNFNLNDILAKPYSDPAHFIFELLQNADDAGARMVVFDIKDDCLVMRHDAKRDFNLRDIEGVTGIGNSSKEGNLRPIGKFGLGFKSVFAITSSPIIYSGDFRIIIENFVVPKPIAGPDFITGTQIILPFNNTSISKERAYGIVSRMLFNLHPSTLLFLNNIREIRWKSKDSENFISKSIKNFPKVQKAKRIKIISASAKEEYMIFYKPINIEGVVLNVEVAYKLSKSSGNRNVIVPLEQSSKLVVYFSTEKETFLNFIVQGPYKTTPNRENIPIDDEKNKIIIEATANLVAESISKVKKMGMLDVSFFKTLPLDKEKISNDIYKPLFFKVKDKLLSERLIPTNNNKYEVAGKITIPKNGDLIQILNKNDLMALFSKKNWISKEMIRDSSGLIRNYLISVLGIRELGNDELLEALNDQFLKKKSDKWLRNFYNYITKYPSLWKEEGYKKSAPLRYKPIIRLENGEMCSPYFNGSVQVYLPSNGTSQYKVVKKYFMKYKDSEAFLKELGLKEPNLYSEIDEYIIPKYRNGPSKPDEYYFNDFLKLMSGYENILQSKKDNFINNLLEINFISAVDSYGSATDLKKPNEVYFLSQDLQTYFEGYERAFFVSEILINKFGKNRVEIFLKGIGISSYPRRIKNEKPAELSKQEMYKRVGYTNHQVIRTDYDYDGLENVLSKLNEHKSIILWNFLLKSLEKYSSYNAKDFFCGKYSFDYYGPHTEYFESTFTLRLKNASWILDKNGHFQKPDNIIFDEVSDLYLKEGENLDTLKSALKFKPDYLSSLPQEDRERLEYARKIPLEKLKTMAESALEDQEPDRKTSQISEFKPEDFIVNVSDYTPTKPKREYSNFGSSEEWESSSSEVNAVKSVDEKYSSQDRKNIGDLGESVVYKYLREKYQKPSFEIEETPDGFNVLENGSKIYEIIWANKHGNKGIGYDFLIRNNEKIVEYIEVKAKTSENLELVEMTGAQWELARELFYKKRGEEYSLYVVLLNAGVKEAKIKLINNPFSMWKEGKIEAHPVNIML